MDTILEFIKAAVTFGGLIALLLLFPIFFIIVFGFATSLDRSLERGDD
ncbi:MAG: hypothetical protein IT333_08005 [Thermomicrobiales bacterium]|nr:hypothetical protein [Thermomicrobiales bacterium]